MKRDKMGKAAKKVAEREKCHPSRIYKIYGLNT
jgi:hypothetical protein